MQFPIGVWSTATKKDQRQYSYQTQIEKHEPFEQFQYSPQMDYSYAPVIQYESPGSTATGATVTTKKEMVTSQEGGGFNPSASSSQEQGMLEQSQGLLMPLLILAGVGIVGYAGYKTYKKKKNKK
jgi:hypothetical protein